MPPSSEFDSDEDLSNLINFLINNNETKSYIQFVYNWMNLNYIDDTFDDKQWDKQIKIAKTNISELFKKSFFVIQVAKIKNSNFIRSNEKSYEFLQESRRFSGQILNLVNIICDKNERLIKVFDIQNKYDLKINNKNLDSELVMIDYSNFEYDFFQKYHKIQYPNDKNIDSFDQSGKCIPFLNNNSLDDFINNSLYNQYSALIIINLINKLISQNLEKLSNKKIGIITLTRSQKNVLKKIEMFW